MEKVRIQHFSDCLCIWAYVAQIRCDELLSEFAEKVEIDGRYLPVFGNVPNKLDSLWRERGGILGYAEHVREVAEGFDHVQVHPEVWIRDTPQSSIPSHLMLCGIRGLERNGEFESGSQQRTAWIVRRAFFSECADISKQAVLLELAERAGLCVAAIEASLKDGRAHAALSEDLELARDQSIRSSPTLVFNEGRQRLTGNVGYRIIEANVRELVESPAGQQSWC